MRKNNDRAAQCLGILAIFLSYEPALRAGPPRCPAHLDWLRKECGDGALAHHVAGRIYLTELSTGESIFIAHGNQPEFSPDSSKLAWIDGTTAKGRMRQGDPTIHTIAVDVDPSGGVHWYNDDEVLLVLDRDERKAWHRVALSGGMVEVPELTRLGTGGYECDVRLGEDGVWSYVANQAWKTSDGGGGTLPGTCSVSLSPDGRSATSLHNPHKECTITAIRPKGYQGTLWWNYRGSFDNQRWSSNDPRFIVCVDEYHQAMVVMTYDGSHCTRMGESTRVRHGLYGDFTVGNGVGTPWPDRCVKKKSAPPGGQWPTQVHGLIFKWDDGKESNTIVTGGDSLRLCRVNPRGQAKLSRFFAMDVTGGAFLAEEEVNEALLAQCKATNQLTVEAVITPHLVEHVDGARIVTFSTNEESWNFSLCQDGERLAWRLRTDSGTQDPKTTLPARLTVGAPHHVIVSYRPGKLQCYFDGQRVRTIAEIDGAFNGWTAQHLVFGDEWCGGHDWAGELEGVALYARFFETEDARQHYDAHLARLSEHHPVPQWTVTAVLRRKEPIPEPTLYPQTLVAYEYQWHRLPVESFDSEKFLVAHWGALNGTVQTNARDLRVGSTYQLTLERFEDHPELSTVKFVTNAESFEMPLFYDVGNLPLKSVEGVNRINGPEEGDPVRSR
ncbi:MAG: hypothetical protein JSU63_17190 [Phycisphaerales bacterium]|nr:MAG: hypothetical protein JSU63_17190 [Phycisphaerales bacterium]